MIRVKEEPKIYEVKCPKCKSILEFDSDDILTIEFNKDGKKVFTNAIECPKCSSRIVLTYTDDDSIKVAALADTIADDLENGKDIKDYFTQCGGPFDPKAMGAASKPSYVELTSDKKDDVDKDNVQYFDKYTGFENDFVFAMFDTLEIVKEDKVNDNLLSKFDILNSIIEANGENPLMASVNKGVNDRLMSLYIAGKLIKPCKVYTKCAKDTKYFDRYTGTEILIVDAMLDILGIDNVDVYKKNSALVMDYISDTVRANQPEFGDESTIMGLVPGTAYHDMLMYKLCTGRLIKPDYELCLKLV